MKLLKVLIVSPLPPPYGGIARWTEQILSYLGSFDSIKINHLNIAVNWRSVHSNSVFRIVGGCVQLLYNYFLFLIELLKGCTVVHLTSSGSFGLVRDLLFGTTCYFLNVNFIIHIRFGRIPEIYRKKGYEYYLLKIIFRFSRHIICIDQRTYNFLLNICSNEKLYLIPNFINFDFNNCQIEYSQRANIINFVGWVKKEKGVEELVSSFLKLQSDDWKLNVIGPIDKDFFTYLDTVYDFDSLKHKISFFGEKNNKFIIGQLERSKLFILPSYTEGFPNVILEAMACKNSIISTNVGAIPEILEDQCGLVINPKDSNELFNALKTVINDEKLQLMMSENAFFRCRSSYSIEGSVSQYIKLWNEDK